MTIFSLATAGTALLAAAPLTAMPPTPPAPIVVMARPVSLATWSGLVTRSLEANLRYPAGILGQDPHEGVVRVRFLCSASGQPGNVSLQTSSGAHDLDREAVRAIARIPTLHPLPNGMDATQRYEALVLFANSHERHDQQMIAVRKEMAASAVRFGNRVPELAMGIMLVPAGAP